VSVRRKFEVVASLDDPNQQSLPIDEEGGAL
jgi:hypothetical protein